MRKNPMVLLMVCLIVSGFGGITEHYAQSRRMTKIEVTHCNDLNQLRSELLLPRKECK